MKKAQITILILILVVVGMLIYVRDDPPSSAESADFGEASEVAGEKILDRVKITFLDIGQGDASFIEFPDGEQMLVDCSEDSRVIEALGRVMDFYDREIDYLLISHPDSDHYGGCQDVLERFNVKNIIYSGYQKNSDQRWQEFMWAIDDEKNDGAKYHKMMKEDFWEIAGVKLHFLYPDHSVETTNFIPGNEKQMNVNNSSIVFKLSYGEEDVLFTGDAEEELEEYLIQTYSDQLDVEILKVGHHGSESSSIQEFLNIVTPEISTISAGQGNKFGHPSRRILKRLERTGSEVWRTDLNRDIILTLEKDKVYVEK